MQSIIPEQGSIMRIGNLIASAGYKKVFLITGQHYKLTTEFAVLNKKAVEHYIKPAQNIDEKEVDEVYRKFLNDSDRAIVAIGGGSVMDLAKTIIYRQIQKSDKIPFFIAAPTTAGSGSEATQFAVIYKDKKKLSLEHPSLLPQIVLLDADLLKTLSPYQFAVSGMDVLCQAIEALWNRNVDGEAKKYATNSIELWNESFLSAVKKNDPAADKKMIMASYFAGKAINITKSTGPHAMSYYLTSYHAVPHGHAVALFLPLFFIYNNASIEICKTIGVENPEEASTKIQQIMKQVGLAIKLDELGIDKEKIIDNLLDEVNEDRFSNNPVAFNREQLKTLILKYL